MAISEHPDDYKPQFSAFKGHPLAGIDAVKTESSAALSELGIHDAEQLIAAVAVADTGRRLAEHVGLSEKELRKIVLALEEMLPQPVAALLGTTQPADLSMGALEPTPEIETEIAELVTPTPVEMEALAAALPSSVDHVKRMPPLRNQGARGTCVAFTLTAVHEFYRASAGASRDYSEQFLYHETKLIDGSPNVCGTWQVKAVRVLSGVGQCRESFWSYNPNLPCNNNGIRPAAARADAMEHRVQLMILNPKDLLAIKSALAGGSVVGFSIPVYNSWYQSAETRRSGRITMRIGNEPRAGGHAMCLVGYQDDSGSPGGGFFILRNSWGPTWGNESPYGAGYGTIPYQYLANDNWEAVTHPPAQPHLRPPRPRAWPWRLADVEGLADEGAARTITIETGGNYDIIIR